MIHSEVTRACLHKLFHCLQKQSDLNFFCVGCLTRGANSIFLPLFLRDSMRNNGQKRGAMLFLKLVIMQNLSI